MGPVGKKDEAMAKGPSDLERITKEELECIVLKLKILDSQIALSLQKETENFKLMTTKKSLKTYSPCCSSAGITRKIGQREPGLNFYSSKEE